VPGIFETYVIKFMRVIGLRVAVSRRCDELPTGALDAFWVSGLAGLGEKPPQKRPSMRNTSSDGTIRERNPMSLQPYGMRTSQVTAM
jgi:hypothetical protein